MEKQKDESIGSVNVFVGFNMHGFNDLIRIHGRLNSERCTYLLENNILGSVKLAHLISRMDV